MKTSFLRLCELVQQQILTGEGDAPLQGSGAESRALQVVKSGLNIRQKQECGNFWDDFLQVMSNTEGVCELLDVRPDQVSKWNHKIRQLKDQAEAEGDGEQKTEMLPTGEPNQTGTK